MNVAITRAKHGVVIIGNRNTLQHEEKWSKVIDILEKNNCVFYQDDWDGEKDFSSGEGWICSSNGSF